MKTSTLAPLWQPRLRTTLGQAALLLWGVLLALALPASANVAGGGSVGPDVTLTKSGSSAILDNGIIRATINTMSGEVTSMKFKGAEMVSQSGKTKIYYSMTTGEGFTTLGNCVYTVVSQSPDMVEISCKRVYPAGGVNAWDIDAHYVLRRGNTGLYSFAIMDHPASYPSADLNEWRIVWWMPHNNTTNDLENIYVDELRHWQMPSYADTKIPPAQSTPIQEIIKLTTGVRAGKYDCKYEYALEQWTTPYWGFASNVNNRGAWAVLGSEEYFNDGPLKQDLVSAAGIIHIYLNQDHFGGSGFTVPAGTAFKKLYGPFLLYMNDKTGADANWADAKAQAAAEKAAWPYAWMNHPLYPNAPARGTVSGRFIVNDPLKPGLTGANAWVGLAQPKATAGEWQFQGKDYQFWVRAGADGSFSIPKVRAGSYTLYAFVDGAVGEFAQDGVTVNAGGTTALGNLMWDVPHPGQNIAWEIGVPNRTTTEFRHGSTDYYEPYLYEQFSSELPNPIEYNVATSDPSKDWNYAHSPYNDNGTLVPWKWRINFNLPAVPTGDCTLTIAYAGVNGGNQYIYVNNESSLFTRFYPTVAGGNALLREGNHAKYSVSYVTIPPSKLKAGANTITLVQASTSGAGNHFMYDYINLETPPPPPIPTPTPPLPAPWQHQDIGAVGVPGTASYAGLTTPDTSVGTFTVNASGDDIWNAADAFHFVYQPLPGNGSIVARVLSVQNTHSVAKAGVMIRDSLNPGSQHAMLVVRPGGSLLFERRLASGGTSTSTSATASGAPQWVKMERSGDTLTASKSADGATWEVVGSDTVPMGGSVFIGMAVTSHDNAVLNTSTFDKVSVAGGGPPPGITVAPTSGLVTNEGGGTATFTIVLNSPPAADVSIGLSSSDATEGSVAPASVAFTPLNWNVPQSVTVTGLADRITDGAQPYSIITAPAVSAGADYNGRNAADVSVTNTDDAVLPRISISAPTSPKSNITAFPTISGTASDSGTGVRLVKVRLQRTTTRDFWNGTAWARAEVLLPATYNPGNSTWQSSGVLPSGATLSESTYDIKAYAQDGAGNVATTSRGLVVNPVAPRISITAPATTLSGITALPPIGGAFLDTLGLNPSGVKLVKFRLQRAVDSRYWSGSAWGTTSVMLPAAINTSNGTWQSSGLLPSGANLTESTYKIIVYAQDAAGNTGSSAIRSLSVNMTKPLIVIDAPPASLNGITQFPTISGRAADTQGILPSGLTLVKFRLIRLTSPTTGQFWNGTSWGTASTLLPVSLTLSNGKWQSSVALPSGANLTTATYRIISYAQDKAGNVGSTSRDVFVSKGS